MGSTPPLTHGTSMGHTPMEYLSMGVCDPGRLGFLFIILFSS